jgi:hypothetical protein
MSHELYFSFFLIQWLEKQRIKITKKETQFIIFTSRMSVTTEDEKPVDKRKFSTSSIIDEPSNEKKISSKFYFACRNNDLEFVIQSLTDLPLEDIDQPEPNRSTALHAACFYRHMDIVKLLLDRGFNRRVLNKFDKTPIDESDQEEIRHLFLRSKISKRFGGEISYEHEKSIWIIVEANEQNINKDRITDMYHGRRLEYGLFQHENIIQQLNNMPKLDVIQRFLRRAVEEKDCTRLIQAYTAETDFYNQINNYLLTRTEDNDLSQFIHTIYSNQQLHDKYSYVGTCYRSILIDSEDQLHLFKKNTKILNRIFLSTTRDRQIAEEYILDRNNQTQISVMMIFRIRHVYTALNIGAVSEFPHEEEVLIMYDSIFKIINVVKKENFYFEIELRESKSNHKR